VEGWCSSEHYSGYNNGYEFSQRPFFFFLFAFFSPLFSKALLGRLADSVPLVQSMELGNRRPGMRGAG
jgi:hypothetical protein